MVPPTAVASSDAATAIGTPNAPATKDPVKDTILTPRFYTTDFEAMAAMDLSPNADELEAICEEFRKDYNRHHFVRNEEFEGAADKLDPETRKVFIEFLEQSCTSEFSGFLLYKELSRRIKERNPLLAECFAHMARDEARHAGFINDALREAGIAVNLGFLTKAKKYTYFRPKFIYYATYLSEKIGYARYITIFRHLEAHPEHRFHPIFKWFKEWCNDEFSHGEAFALLMKTDPKLTSGINVYWIKFFLTAVYATMYVRDHQRPAFHKALGIDPSEYGQEVFAKTSELSRQIFPITLDIDNPRWIRNLKKMHQANLDLAEAENMTGLSAIVTRLGARLNAGLAFVSLMTIPAKSNTVPASTRLEPVY